MSIHLIKNGSKTYITEIQNKNAQKDLNETLINNTKTFNGIINDTKENSKIISEKNLFFFNIKNNQNDSINETMITDSKVNTNSIYQKTSTKYILKRVNNKLHSSRSEIIISKEKNPAFLKIEQDLKNNIFTYKKRNHHYDKLKEIEYTFNQRNMKIKKNIENLKQRYVLSQYENNKEREKEKIKEIINIQKSSKLSLLEKNKLLDIYAHDEISDDTEELKKSASCNYYITPDFDKTKFQETNSFNIFYQKYHKDKDIIRKGGKKHETPSFNLIRATKKFRVIPNPIGVVKKKGEENNLDLSNKMLGDDYIKCLIESLKISKHLTSLSLEKNRLSDISIIPLFKTILNNNALLGKLIEINLSYNKIGIISVELLVKYIKQNECSLENLNMESNGLGVNNSKKIIGAITKYLNLRMKYLNLAKNLLNDDVTEELSILIKNCKDLNVLILYQNQFSNFGGGLLMSEIKKHNNLKILDLSWNLIGTNLREEINISQLNISNTNENNSIKNNFILRKNASSPEKLTKKVSYFTSQLCELFHNSETELLHLDISYNNINYIDAKAISEHIKSNHTILGMHVDGNDMYTDCLGFIYPLEKSDYKHDHFAKSHLFYRLSNEHPLISSNVINTKKLRCKNNCWICEGWREIKFNYSSPNPSSNNKNDFIKIYLNFENYKNNDLNELNYVKKENNFQTYRMCPPGEVYFFISKNGPPITNYGPKTIHLKDNIIFTEDTKHLKYEDEKIDYDIKNLKKYTVNKVSHKTVQINTEVIDNKNYINKLKHCIPRAVKVLKKRKGPWSFNNSIWSWYGYNLNGESLSLLNDAFNFDYDRCDFEKDKDLLDNEKYNFKNTLKKRYKKIVDTYKNLSAHLDYKIWQIDKNKIIKFAQRCQNLLDDKYSLNDILLKYNEVKSNAIDKLERKINPNIPDNIIRHQFMMLLVKIAKDKYYKTKKIEKLSEAVNYAFINNFESYLNNFDNNKWRTERYYLEEIDNILKAHIPIFDAVFYSYAQQHIIDKKDSYWLTMDKFYDLCLNLIDNDFSTIDIPVIFNISIKLIKDEIHSNKHYNMLFPEFLEAICRFIDKLSPIPNDEDPLKWDTQRRQDQSLFQKIETMIPRLIRVIKGNYKDVKDKFILPIKDEKTGKYIINYENPFYENKLPPEDF